jgi:hypothetical protein
VVPETADYKWGCYGGDKDSILETTNLEYDLRGGGTDERGCDVDDGINT